jgi:type II secretory pathway pseudopilin PulG
MKKPSRQAGYNLVMLMVLLTVLNIAVAASLPSWSSVIRRDKEEELIFRGLQYAEAIRVFQNRFQRSPVRLEELLEVEPRSIRQLWKDPMTENGKWVLIPLQGPTGLQVPPDQQDQQDQQDGQDGQGGDDDNGRDGDSGDGDGGGFGPKDEVQIGPFKGVHSRSGKTSFLLFNGKDRYDEWHFTVDLLLGSGQPLNESGVGVPPTVQPGQQQQQQQQQLMRTRWIGRPLPEFLQPRQDSGLPDENNSFGRDNQGEDQDRSQNGRRRGSGKP